MTQDAIAIRSLTFRYLGSETPCLSNIDLSIRKGEFVIVTGPTGCGKTTLCRCLNGLIPNFYAGEMNGEVIVDGLVVKEHSTSELAKHVGFVFQNPENQLFSLSVERDIAFGPENLGLSRAEIRRRVEWALAVTGITDLRDRPPYELSGGQQQRAAIASVLAMQPTIMVFDEPTSYLDPKSAQGILDFISKLNKQLKVTVVLVEHRLDLASKHATRVVVMHGGMVAIDGMPSEAFSEEARLIGVGLPKVTLLFHLLKNDGLQFHITPVTVEEAAAELRRCLL